MKLKIVILCGTLAILACVAFMPSARGYGTNFVTAEIITTGTTTESFNPAFKDAYFKISCQANDILKVMVTFDNASNDFDLTLYTPDYTNMSSDQSDAIETLISAQNLCQVAGYYYIRIWENGNGTDTIVLTVETPSEDPIPGFDTATMIVAIILSVGLAWYLMARRARHA